MKRQINQSRIDELEAELYKQRSKQKEYDVINSIEDAVCSKFENITGISCEICKYKFLQDGKYMVIAWSTLEGHSVFWYTNPGRIPISSPKVLPVNYSSKELNDYVQMLVAEFTKELNKFVNSVAGIVKQDYSDHFDDLINYTLYGNTYYRTGGPDTLEPVDVNAAYDTISQYIISKEFSKSIVNQRKFISIIEPMIDNSALFNALKQKIESYNMFVNVCNEVREDILSKTWLYPIKKFSFSAVHAYRRGLIVDYVINLGVETTTKVYYDISRVTGYIKEGMTVADGIADVTKSLESQFNLFDRSDIDIITI